MRPIRPSQNRELFSTYVRVNIRATNALKLNDFTLYFNVVDALVLKRRHSTCKHSASDQCTPSSEMKMLALYIAN